MRAEKNRAPERPRYPEAPLTRRFPMMRRRVAEPGYEGVERVERVDGYEDRDSVVEERSHFDPATRGEK